MNNSLISNECCINRGLCQGFVSSWGLGATALDKGHRTYLIGRGDQRGKETQVNSGPREESGNLHPEPESKAALSVLVCVRLGAKRGHC